jgi:methyl-accepting chemotaxis protein
VGVSRALVEQRDGVSEVTKAIEAIRLQSEQAAKAIGEQARAAKLMTVSSENIAKQIRLISSANREQSGGAQDFLKGLAEIRRNSDANFDSARATRDGTDELLQLMQDLGSLLGMDSHADRGPGNWRTKAGKPRQRNGAHQPSSRPAMAASKARR